MKLYKIVLKDIRNFSFETSFDFSKSQNINTISGINGSGKSTVFRSLLICQKCYFIRLDDFSEYDNDDFLNELSKFFNSTGAFIEVVFNHALPDATPLLSSFKVVCASYQKGRALWSIVYGENKSLLDEHWNIENPRNVIVYIDSNKSFKEDDVLHSKISIPSQDEYNQLVIDTILNPENLFTNIYQRLVKDYLRERLVPGIPRKDIYFIVTKMLLKKIIPSLELSNFSGQQFPNQFVLLGKNSRNKKANFYDARNLSSGEKVLFYSLLFINYVPRIGLLIIDEPENHFHEELLVRFINMLSDICASATYSQYVLAATNDKAFIKSNESAIKKVYVNHNLSQVYLLTHAKNLIYNNFSSGANFYIENGLKTLEFENFESILREVGLSSIYSKVLFVEGTTETALFTTLFNAHNIKIHSLGGCSQVIETYKKILDIKGYLRDYHFCFLIDRDTRSDSNIEELRNKDVAFFDKNFIVLEKHELENYLLDPNIFKAIIATHHASDVVIDLMDNQEIDSQIFLIASDLKEHAFKKDVLNLNHQSVSKLKDKLIKKTIPVDSIAAYNSHLAIMLSATNIESFLSGEFSANYNNAFGKYNGANWDDNWKAICDGKIVYNKTLAFFSDYLQVKKNRLEREIRQSVLDNSGLEINRVIDIIIKKFI